MNEKLIKLIVKDITVLWSESSMVNDTLGCDENYDIDKTFSFDILADLFLKAATSELGYDKTKMKVNLFNGESFECRMDISPDENNLCDFVSRYLED